MSAPRVVIIGAGPAGLSAAVTAGRVGMSVIVVDERRRPGGRLLYDPAESIDLEETLVACERLGVEVRLSTTAWGLFPGWQVALETSSGSETLECEHVILTPGAIDRGLAFDGNTLPGVMTGSGLRRLIGEFGVLPGKRVLILGDGPEGALTAHVVRSAGGRVVALLSEVEARTISVQGAHGVERVLVGDKEYPADIVAVAVGREPDLQLASMGEQSLAWIPEKGGWAPHHDHAETGNTPTGIFVAGDAAGPDIVDICVLDGAYAATKLAQSLGLVGSDEVDSLASQIAARRPNRMHFSGSEPTYRQPWRVPLGEHQ